jgi:cell division protein FtsB
MKFQFRRAVMVLAFFSVLAGIHLYITTQNVTLKYRLTDTKIKLEELRAKNRQTGNIVAAKENMAYVEKQARGKLGMVYPEKIRYISVTKEAATRP